MADEMGRMGNKIMTERDENTGGYTFTVSKEDVKDLTAKEMFERVSSGMAKINADGLFSTWMLVGPTGEIYVGSVEEMCKVLLPKHRLLQPATEQT